MTRVARSPVFYRRTLFQPPLPPPGRKPPGICILLVTLSGHSGDSVTCKNFAQEGLSISIKCTKYLHRKFSEAEFR